MNFFQTEPIDFHCGGGEQLSPRQFFAEIDELSGAARRRQRCQFHRSFRAVFDRLNTEYFGGRLHKPRIGWTLQDAWRTHGHYDPAHDTIVLSRTLDDPATPPFVVDFIVYHEMLHVLMPAERRDGRHMHHTTAFRTAEAAFPRMREAVAWLEAFCAGNGTRRRKGRSKGRG